MSGSSLSKSHSPTDLRAALNRWTPFLPRLLGSIVSALVVISILQQLYLKFLPFPLAHGEQLLKRLSLGGEMTFTAWFSASMLILCGISSAIIATISSPQKRPHTWRWWGLSILFVAMSADEALAMHEMLIGPFRDRFKFDGFLYFGWVVAGDPSISGDSYRAWPYSHQAASANFSATPVRSSHIFWRCGGY